MKGISHGSIREHNIKVVLRCLYNHPLSCSEISKEIKISDVAANKITKELQASDLIREVKDSGVNKKIGGQHRRFEINSEKAIFICIDFTHGVDKVYVYDFSASLIAEMDLNITSNINADSLVSIVEQIKKFLVDNNLENKKILSIAIAFVGQVDSETTCILSSGRFGSLIGVNLGQIFEESFSAPVIIKNNVQFMSVGEMIYGNLKPENSIGVYLFIDYGTSVSILNNRVPIEGWRGFSGETGSVSVSDNGNIDYLCSLAHLINRTENELDQRSVRGLINAFSTNAKVKEKVLESCKYIGRLNSFFVNILGADIIVIGGRSSEFGESYLSEVIKQTEMYAHIPTKIVLSECQKPVVKGMLEFCIARAIEDIALNRKNLSENGNLKEDNT